MTNKQIIRAAAERLDPATLHQIAAAHHTPEEIAAVAASCKIVDKDGNEQPATIADVEIMFAADELHTFDHWKKEGKSVKKGEKALTECYLWKYTTKPSKEQREKAAAEGKEAAPDPHYYPTKSHLFSCLQVESSKPAPQARFKSTAEIIAYNKQLAAERKAAKAAKEAAEKAAAETVRPAPIIVEEHHELPELVHVEPLPTKPAPKKPRTTKKPAADVAELKKAERKAMHEFMAVPETDRAGQAATLEAWRKATATRKAAEKAADEAPAVTVDMKKLQAAFTKHYSRLYHTHDDHESGEYLDAVDRFDELSGNDPQFTATVQKFNEYTSDLISSDREAAAFVMALDELEKDTIPEMVPSVQQLDFASIAAGVLA
ncbi:hypothetical protein J3353_02350 [Faecalibacterium sp. Marseille-Q4137]|uniref:ArdC-like ssDNA-binding domain-containing protein n=1 Tax=Faecalibacterium sp. Marseille-Q4137 TaxID=2817021 RepID=UPI001A9ADFE6|nr:ArdC-like ssDNA-binding domain-containing protein [Faecalibacterium sp. Marseille-Q4137]MBO1301857.1 hypothetical protein [Faecalibacterium sp. Marseille-Q4137]